MTRKRFVRAVVLSQADIAALDALTLRAKGVEGALSASRSSIIRQAIRKGLPLVDAELRKRGL